VQFLQDFYFDKVGKAYPENIKVASLDHLRPDKKDSFGHLKAISPEELRHAMLLAIARDIKRNLDVSEWRKSLLSVTSSFQQVDSEDALFTLAACERESIGAKYETLYYSVALA
jgi:hypothetical protein